MHKSYSIFMVISYPEEQPKQKSGPPQNIVLRGDSIVFLPGATRNREGVSHTAEQERGHRV